ncbi:MAG: hypothetical protein V8T45_02745 [Oscillospiraceae bacterium]
MIWACGPRQTNTTEITDEDGIIHAFTGSGLEWAAWPDGNCISLEQGERNCSQLWYCPAKRSI